MRPGAPGTPELSPACCCSNAAGNPAGWQFAERLRLIPQNGVYPQLGREPGAPRRVQEARIHLHDRAGTQACVAMAHVLAYALKRVHRGDVHVEIRAHRALQESRCQCRAVLGGRPGAACPLWPPLDEKVRANLQVYCQVSWRRVQGAVRRMLFRGHWLERLRNRPAIVQGAPEGEDLFEEPESWAGPRGSPRDDSWVQEVAWPRP